jgi:hypothetical protein
MNRIFPLKFQLFPCDFRFSLFFFFSFLCQNSWAAQDAIVTADRAIIYADELMTSPVGYVNRGKKIRIGDIARNKAQIYPIIVSGKMAYIRVIDISTQKESVDAERLLAERFMKSTQKAQKTRYSLSYVSFMSQITQQADNTYIKSKDSLVWNGVNLKGEVVLEKRWALQVMAGYLATKKVVEQYSVIEIGLGSSYRIIDAGRFILKAEAQITAIPYASYGIGSDFTVHGYGFGAGGGLNASYRFNESWGLEGYAGVFAMKLTHFKIPVPYNIVDPSFIGSRTGLGVFYQF